jgi:hypothetical protein
MERYPDHGRVEPGEVACSQNSLFYGATEFTVKDPVGHLITFAQFGKP